MHLDSQAQTLILVNRVACPSRDDGFEGQVCRMRALASQPCAEGKTGSSLEGELPDKESSE